MNWRRETRVVKPTTQPERPDYAGAVIEPDARCDRCGGIGTSIASRICGRSLDDGRYASFRGAIVLCSTHTTRHRPRLTANGWHITKI